MLRWGRPLTGVGSWRRGCAIVEAGAAMEEKMSDQMIKKGKFGCAILSNSDTGMQKRPCGRKIAPEGMVEEVGR